MTDFYPLYTDAETGVTNPYDVSAFKKDLPSEMATEEKKVIGTRSRIHII